MTGHEILSDALDRAFDACHNPTDQILALQITYGLSDGQLRSALIEALPAWIAAECDRRNGWHLTINH